MPRDLFGDVLDPSIKVGSRKWYTVPFSLAAHTFVALILIIAPLLATGALPLPASSVVFVPIVASPVPPAPPVKRAEQPARAFDNQNAAPVTEPATIEQETGLEPGFETGVEGGTGVTALSLVEGIEARPEPPPLPRPATPTKVRVSDGINPPVKVHDVAPLYPPVAQAAHIEGVVIIEATIDVDGLVQHARILRSAALLDEAALAAVRQWIYTPTRLNGQPVSVVMTVTVHFRLK
jgi:periplasmic protein TonB